MDTISSKRLSQVTCRGSVVENTVCQDLLLFGNPALERCRIMELWEFGVDVFKYDTYVLHVVSPLVERLFFALFKESI